jgi:hypothetical protein
MFKATTQRRFTIFVAIAAALLVIAAVWVFTQGPGVRWLSPPGSTVVEVTGSGDQTTESFHVRQGWRIRWDSAGERFALSIRGERDLGTVIDNTEPAGGVTSPAGAGTFHLEIVADGSWSVRIEQGE